MDISCNQPLRKICYLTPLLPQHFSLKYGNLPPVKVYLAAISALWWKVDLPSLNKQFLKAKINPVVSEFMDGDYLVSWLEYINSFDFCFTPIVAVLISILSALLPLLWILILFGAWDKHIGLGLLLLVSSSHCVVTILPLSLFAFYFYGWRTFCCLLDLCKVNLSLSHSHTSWLIKDTFICWSVLFPFLIGSLLINL